MIDDVVPINYSKNVAPFHLQKGSETSEESISRIGQRRWVGILETS